MKICEYKGLSLVILTRNEHCPPHVHVGDADWEARFKFSFWHDGVCLWDVVPAHRKPGVRLLEQLRQTLMQPANLREARQLWWKSRDTVCMENLLWDPTTNTVISPKAAQRDALAITSARLDAAQYMTVLELAGQADPLEIEHG